MSESVTAHSNMSYVTGDPHPSLYGAQWALSTPEAATIATDPQWAGLDGAGTGSVARFSMCPCVCASVSDSYVVRTLSVPSQWRQWQHAALEYKSYSEAQQLCSGLCGPVLASYWRQWWPYHWGRLRYKTGVKAKTRDQCWWDIGPVMTAAPL